MDYKAARIADFEHSETTMNAAQAFLQVPFQFRGHRTARVVENLARALRHNNGTHPIDTWRILRVCLRDALRELPEEASTLPCVKDAREILATLPK